MKDIFESFNPWWSSSVDFAIIDRPKYDALLDDLREKKDIKILCGLRRVGKTTLMKSQIMKLLKSGTNPKHILFLSFDAIALQSKTLFELVMYYRELHSIPKNKNVYLFLDEITYLPSFNQELKTLYDIGTYTIFASSSSAKVLVDNKAFLTGRARYIDIFPLDFDEYCFFIKRKLIKLSAKDKRSVFEEYLQHGGIPEYVLTKDMSYLTEITDMIIAKDIIAKHNIKQKQKVYELFSLLCERVGKQISYSKIANILDIDRESVSTYIQYFLDTYLFEQIDVYGKINQKIKGAKKLYCVDIGIRNSVTGFRDLGAIYENVVYQKIRKFNPSYYKIGPIEIDFAFDNVLIEAKLDQELTIDQEIVFEDAPFKTKIIAQGISFFLIKQPFED